MIPQLFYTISFRKYLTKYQTNVKIVSIDTKTEREICKRKGSRMSIHTSKYTNHTKEEIEEYLNRVKKSVNLDNFIVVVSFHKPEKNIEKLFL